jgi:hypothetical protein
MEGLSLYPKEGRAGTKGAAAAAAPAPQPVPPLPALARLGATGGASYSILGALPGVRGPAGCCRLGDIAPQ